MGQRWDHYVAIGIVAFVLIVGLAVLARGLFVFRVVRTHETWSGFAGAIGSLVGAIGISSQVGAPVASVLGAFGMFCSLLYSVHAERRERRREADSERTKPKSQNATTVSAQPRVPPIETPRAPVTSTDFSHIPFDKSLWSNIGRTASGKAMIAALSWQQTRESTIRVGSAVREIVTTARTELFKRENAEPNAAGQYWTSEKALAIALDMYALQQDRIIEALLALRDGYGLQDETLNKLVVNPQSLDDISEVASRIVALVDGI
ncbi:MAG TPA: hypothetical protein VHS78_17480 [Candidatus Elarobacter sp.]|jgi:hypothetical protein|nr:hypothetical protein [Candidatus Elarobacter sp.]